MKILANKPISEYIHAYIVRRLRRYSAKSVIDIGGTGKFRDRGFDVVNANIKNGINGLNLPYKDESFDVSVSVATLEHVKNQTKFIDEAIRVAKKASIHWFPMGSYAEKIEMFKAQFGHNHPCRVPREAELLMCMDSQNGDYTIATLMSCSEHLLLLAATYPDRLNIEPLYDAVFNYYGKPYGTLLEIRK